MIKKAVCSIYDEIAEWFDTARDKSLVEKENLDFILRHLPKSPTVLDLGCGTGEPIARYFIEAGSLVTGIDGSARMIKYCKERFPEHVWLVADMRDLDLESKFDCVLAWDSMFHLSCEDQRKMFPLFQRHVEQGGILMFSCGEEEDEFWNPMHGNEAVSMFHASLDSEEYKKLLTENGFEILKHKISDENCGGRAYWIARKI